MLDKAPSYALLGPVIESVVPNARFIHLIRDGRDVVNSLLRASRGFGRGWAPETADAAARMWRSHVETARKLAGRANYFELRFEDLRSERGPRVLEDAYAFSGVHADSRFCRSILSEFALRGEAAHRPPRRTGLLRRKSRLTSSGRVQREHGGKDSGCTSACYSGGKLEIYSWSSVTNPMLRRRVREG